MGGVDGRGDGLTGGERIASPAINQAGETRSTRIESLRALAAVAVLVGHVELTSLTAGGEAVSPLSLGQKLLYGGGAGVFFFFALTGYLLYWPFAKRDFGEGVGVNLKRYASNRALRILPLYYTVIVVVLALRQGSTATVWAHFLTFTQNFSEVFAGKIVGPAWSLVVEIQFYALLPLLALAIAKVARGSIRRAGLVLAIVALVSLTVRQHYVYAPSVPSTVWRYNMPATFLFFVPGMMLALVRTSWEGSSPEARWLSRPILCNTDLWLASTIPLWAAAVFVSYDLDWMICLAAFLTIGACVLPLSPGRLIRALEWRPLAAVGVASYSLYLWHLPLIGVMVNELGVSTSLASLAAVAIPVALLVAGVSYALVERPFLRLRRQWSASAAPKGGSEVVSGG